MDKKLLKQHKATFHFGTSVRYEKILTRGEGEQDKSCIGTSSMRITKEWRQEQVSARTGIVVGWRWLSNGIRNYDSEDGNSYTATESLFVIEIKRGMMNRVDLALPESLTINEGAKYWYSPLFVGIIPDRIPTMSDKGRKWLSNEMKSVPRDSKGRWK